MSTLIYEYLSTMIELSKNLKKLIEQKVIFSFHARVKHKPELGRAS